MFQDIQDPNSGRVGKYNAIFLHYTFISKNTYIHINIYNIMSRYKWTNKYRYESADWWKKRGNPLNNTPISLFSS